MFVLVEVLAALLAYSAGSARTPLDEGPMRLLVLLLVLVVDVEAAPTTIDPSQ